MFKKHISFTVARKDLTRVMATMILDQFVRDIQVDINASRVKSHYVVSIHCDNQYTNHYLNTLMELVRSGSGVYNVSIN